jgi:UDPglucose--hexose-1-phosphate uridylyltransferase
MTKIAFESRKQVAVFQTPSLELDRHEIEIRLDPLTGHQSISTSGLRTKGSMAFPKTDQDYLRKFAEDTRTRCFLCDGKWEKTTPRYDSRVIEGGRMVEGECVLFPNLFPLAPYHAVIMVGKDHFRCLNEFPVSLFRDAFSLALQFIRRCHEADREMQCFTINGNYLLPAGSSVLHPHLQILGFPWPTSHEELLHGRSLEYYREKGACYWLDLARTEQELGERWIGTIGETSWFAAYSPMGINEVNAVWHNAQSFLEWDRSDVDAMAEGLSRTLSAYHAMNCSTFNFSCLCAPMDGEAHPEFRSFLRLVNRQNVTPNYRTDDFYLQKLLQTEIILQVPEDLASFLRGFFSK